MSDLNWDCVAVATQIYPNILQSQYWKDNAMRHKNNWILNNVKDLEIRTQYEAMWMNI